MSTPEHSDRSSTPLEPTESHYTVQQIADWLGVHHQSVRAWIRNGELPATRIKYGVRVRRSDFLAWYDQNAHRSE